MLVTTTMNGDNDDYVNADIDAADVDDDDDNDDHDDANEVYDDE